MEQVTMIPVEVNFKPSAKYWTASCPGLDLATQGETFERAEQNIREALSLFVESCLRRGTLEAVLRRAGYSNWNLEDTMSKKFTIDEPDIDYAEVMSDKSVTNISGWTEPNSDEPCNEQEYLDRALRNAGILNAKINEALTYE
jgi:predicted RNase H-like HicB family nuclease